MREQEERQRRTEDAQRTRHEERILSRTGRVGGVLLNNRENIRSHEGTNLAHRGGDPIVLATDGSSTRFGGNQSDVVTRTKLTKRQKDSSHVSRDYKISEGSSYP